MPLPVLMENVGLFLAPSRMPFAIFSENSLTILVDDEKDSLIFEEELKQPEKLNDLIGPLTLDSEDGNSNSTVFNVAPFSFCSARNVDGKPLKFLKNTGPLQVQLPFDHSEQMKQRRFATPIHRILENVENKLIAKSHQAKYGFDVEMWDSKVAEQQVSQLWVDKYRPSKYTELSCNMEVLKWIKQWDYVRERFAGQESKTVVKVNNAASSFKRNRYDANSYFDSYNRPEKKILMIHGPPGLGKTTLAHIIARTAGYAVIEINASDERTGNTVINKISAAIQVQSSFTVDKRPSLIVIDEIDGASAAGNEMNLIRYLVKLATEKGPAKASKGKAAENDTMENDDESNETNYLEKSHLKPLKKNAANLLIRPIICICNDLYVPALRPLRQVAQIVQVKPLSPVQLSLRLKSICDEESLKINTRTLVELADTMDSDLRSSLNALQFLQNKQKLATKNNVSQIQVTELNINTFKDSVKTPFKIYDSIFHNSMTSTGGNNNNSSRKHDTLLQMIWTSGVELDRLMTGCFDLYPQAKFFDNVTMDRVNQGLEVFSHFDMLNNISAHGTAGFIDGKLNGYMLHEFAKLKNLFATPMHFQMKYPKQDYENYQAQSEVKSIMRDYANDLPTFVRSSHNFNSLLLDRIPTIMTVLNQFNAIKSSNPQLMRTEDRHKLNQIVVMMLEEGLQFNQVRLPDGSGYKFVLDPAIDKLALNLTILNPSANNSGVNKSDMDVPQDSHSYALCRLISAEIEAIKIKRQKAKQDAIDMIPKTSLISSSPAVKRAAPTPPALPPKKVPRDFFGRPIVETAEDSQHLNPSKLSNTAKSSNAGMKLWYVHNDGVSNAVRRNIKVSAFIKR